MHMLDDWLTVNIALRTGWRQSAAIRDDSRGGYVVRVVYTGYTRTSTDK